MDWGNINTWYTLYQAGKALAADSANKVPDSTLLSFLKDSLGYSDYEAHRIIYNLSTVMRRNQAEAMYLNQGNAPSSGGTNNTQTNTTPAIDWSSYKEGQQVSFNWNGKQITRYVFPDSYGNTLLAQNSDGTNTDFVIKDGNPVYVVKDDNNIWYNPDTNKQFSAYNSQWSDYTPASPDINIDPNAPLSATDQANLEYIQSQTGLNNAQAQKYLNDINSPTTTDSEKNAAAIQLYGWLMSYVNNNNQNATTQWNNQASNFNTAYGNAIDQNKWLQDMSTSPLNTVAYLNLIRGQMPPNWNLPNYQKMPDAFQGWNQQQPQTQPLPDTAQIQAILQGLGWGNTANTQQGTPVPSVTTPDNVVHQMPYTSPNVWNINPEGTGYTNANTGQNVSAVETQSTQNPYANQIVEAARLAKQWEPYKDQPTPQGATYRTYKALLDSLTKKAGITT